MGRKSFDELIIALQSALDSAQDALERRREKTAQRMCAADETGASRSSVLTFSMPGNGMDEKGYETLSLPASSFHGRYPRIASLSLEFECELKKENLFCVSPVDRLVMKIRKKGRARGENRHRVLIAFHGKDRNFGEVRMDGELLMVIPRRWSAGVGRPAIGSKRSIFHSLLNMLRDLRRPREFVMTEEQTGRAREIVEQSKFGTPVSTESSR